LAVEDEADEPDEDVEEPDDLSEPADDGLSDDFSGFFSADDGFSDGAVAADLLSERLSVR
jgi:hypothetical protein